MLMENVIIHLVEVQVLRHVAYPENSFEDRIFYSTIAKLVCQLQVVQQFGIPNLFDLPIRPTVSRVLNSLGRLLRMYSDTI